MQDLGRARSGIPHNYLIPPEKWVLGGVKIFPAHTITWGAMGVKNFLFQGLSSGFELSQHKDLVDGNGNSTQIHHQLSIFIGL